MSQNRQLFDKGWTVHVGGDIAHSRRVTAKAATANGWSDLTNEERDAAGHAQTVVESMGRHFQAVKVRPSSADAAWEPVDLPHDWRIKTKPVPDYPVPDDYPRVWQGFFRPGVAYYRKLFEAPELSPHDRVSITFEGISGFSDVWLNGFWIGQQSSGYSPLTIDLTELLRPVGQGPNVLLVRADSTEAEGWWYEGGGIYRHVWLDVFSDVFAVPDSLYVRTPEASEKEALVLVNLEIRNESPESVTASVVFQVTDAETGEEVVPASSVPGTPVASSASVGVSAEFKIASPKLWQLGKGGLYNMTATVSSTSGGPTSVASTKFGIRTIEWVDDGVRVNGKWTKLYGANIHQDWAVFGVALPDRVIEQKLELCAEVGFNAVRTAHHAPTPELVDHADRMGMLLLLENRNFSTSTACLEELRSLVRRFRSRPSVLIWSIENEEMDLQGTAVGRGILQRLVREIKALDPDRPTVFGGVVSFDDASYYGLTDVVGMHYRSFFGVLDQTISYVPDKPHILDEEGLYPSTRGVYHYDKEKAHAGSLSSLRDVMSDNPNPAANAALMPPNFKITGNTAADLTTAYNHPKSSGTFVWAGLDYIGEPTPQRWPATTSSYGTRDLIGLPKDYYWLLRSICRPEPLVHAFPHWTWPGSEGQKLPFRVYSNCEAVEFVVNGTPVARFPVKGSMVVAPDGIEYQPGELVVRGYNGDKLAAEHRQITVGTAARLSMTADRSTLSTSGKDVSLVRVAITDVDGNLIPDYDGEVQFTVEGSGYLIGVHNADPSIHDYASVSSTKAFNGFVGAYVGSGTQAGEIRLLAAAEGLETGSTLLTVSDDEPEHKVHVVDDEAQNTLFGGHFQYS